MIDYLYCLLRDYLHFKRNFLSLKNPKWYNFTSQAKAGEEIKAVCVGLEGWIYGIFGSGGHTSGKVAFSGGVIQSHAYPNAS